MCSRDIGNLMRRPGRESSTHASSAEAVVTAAGHVHFRPSFSFSICQMEQESGEEEEWRALTRHGLMWQLNRVL